MSKFKTLKLLILFTFIAVNFVSISASQPTTVWLIHFNDLHGKVFPYKTARFGGVEKEFSALTGLAQALLKLRFEAAFKGIKTAFICAGDIWQGTLLGTLTGGKAIAKLLNRMDMEVSTLGNHEFDLGKNATEKFINTCNFPFVVDNIDGLPVDKWLVKTYGNVKVGFLGIAPLELPEVVCKESLEGIKFYPEVFKILNKYVKLLRNKLKVNAVILISHAGTKVDRIIAKKVPGIDVIIGGHDHTPSGPEFVGNTLITDCSPYGTMFGIVELKFDNNGKLIKKSGWHEWLYASKYPPRFSFLEFAKKLEKSVEPLKNRYICTLKEPLFNDLAENAPARFVHYVNINGEKEPIETNFGNLVCDAIRAKFGVDIAFQNKGGIRITLKKGDVTYADMFEAFPFENFIVILKMTGKEIKQVLEQGLTFKKGAIDFSGLKVWVDLSKPEFQRVVKVTLLNGEELKEDKVYTVALNNFLAGGGDYFKIFAKIKNRKSLPNRLRETVIDFIKGKKDLVYEIDGRYIVVNEK